MNPVRRFGLPALLLLVAPALAAQVGHAPGDSPYRDIDPGTAWELYAGKVFGPGGPIPVGPRDGALVGGRVLLRARNTISIGFGFWSSLTQRTVLDPDASLANRYQGSVDQTLYGLEATILMNLTGGKSWHRIAPYVGAGIGLVKSSAFTDPAGYEFGTKFYFAPTVGSRLIVNRRLYLKVEARGFAWKLGYPASYALEPSAEPGTADNPNAVNPTGRSGQYVLAPALAAGFGFAF